MPKVMIIYESKYGNTRLVAESIIEGIRAGSEIETILREFEEVDLNHLVDFDVIVVGSPNHIGRATGDIRKFIDKLGKLNLEERLAAVFNTYIGRDYEKSVKKMERQLSEKVPGLKLVVPGLSIKAEGIKGPVAKGELPKCKEFWVKIAI